MLIFLAELFINEVIILKLCTFKYLFTFFQLPLPHISDTICQGLPDDFKKYS